MTSRMCTVRRRTSVRLFAAAMCLFATQASFAIPISDMGQIAITVYINDTHSPDPPQLVGNGSFRYDRAYVDGEVASHSDESGFYVSFPIVDGSFEMFGVIFEGSDIEWQQGYDFGELSSIGVSMQNAAGDILQFAADSEDYSFIFEFLNGYSGNQAGFPPCYVSTPSGGRGRRTKASFANSIKKKSPWLPPSPARSRCSPSALAV